MELAFATRNLRALCEDEGRAYQVIGPNAAASLKDRLADLRAANSLADVLVGSLRLLSQPEPTVTLELADGYLMLCRVNHSTLPVLPTGEVEWNRVRRLLIKSIDGVI